MVPWPEGIHCKYMYRAAHHMGGATIGSKVWERQCFHKALSSSSSQSKALRQPLEGPEGSPMKFWA
eukprot:10874026-Karenia_brevis.AAC.1